MHQLTLKRRYYITASAGNTHRVLKIDRTEADTLNVVEDSMQYDDEQRDLLLRMVEDGNKSQGGLNHLLNFYGIVGFVKFTTVWYLIVITQRSVVGLLGGHYSELGLGTRQCLADLSLSLRQDKGDELTPLPEADHQLLPISQKTNNSAQEARCVLPSCDATDTQSAQSVRPGRPVEELLLLVGGHLRIYPLTPVTRMTSPTRCRRTSRRPTTSASGMPVSCGTTTCCSPRST